MKLHKKAPKEENRLERKGKRGPIPTVGGERMNFFPGDSLDEMGRLNKLYRRNGLKEVSKAYALREGVRQWINQRIKEVKSAQSGSFHAKKRK